MREVLKYGALAIGLWWLLKDRWPASSSSTPSAPSPANAVPQTPVATPMPAPAPAQPGAPTEAAILLAASNPALASSVPGTLFTADEWNFWNALATGVQTTTDLFTPGNRGEKISAQEYWNRRLAAGLSGIRGWRV